MSDPVLIVDGLNKAYRRRPILSDVSFRIDAGEAVAVLGSNGAGKSTLLGCLIGDRVPDSGSVSICGSDPFSDPRAVAKCMGFVPEHPFLYGELTVAEMLRFVAEARGMDREEAEREMVRLLDLFTLTGAEDALCRELSQGMGRKVAITVALLHRPRLVVLDEVFNGLDRPSTERLLEELGERRREGSAVLLSSHDLFLLAEWCDRGLLLARRGVRDMREDGWQEWRENPVLPPADTTAAGS